MILSDNTFKVQITGKCKNCPCRVLEMVDAKFIDGQDYVCVACEHRIVCDRIEEYLMGVIGVE